MMIKQEELSHWEGCWKDPGHHDCAIRMVEGLQRRFESGYRSQIEHAAGIGRCVPVPSRWRIGEHVRVIRTESGDTATPESRER
jgi:hypothetical protein